MAFNKETDTHGAHKFFSASCFNSTWNLLDNTERSQADDLSMEHSAQASLWHWKQREDCTPTHLSIGYWQVSRVYAALKQPQNSLRYAVYCQELSERHELEAFYIGYAYEALARAEALAGNTHQAQGHGKTARHWASKIEDPENQAALIKDLDQIKV